ncbi:MAG: T9SS type A sorting domain-containing protein, partial [Flavobacteriia bacterium]|nr:T9SS type A sorting domain-containing protein [Flavobacteriia bacterium]
PPTAACARLRAPSSDRPGWHNGTGGGGGGGGGYFGGGSGGNGSDTTPGGGGGGGSSFTGTLTSSSTSGGTNSGNGSVVITVTASSVPAEPTGLSGNTNSCDGDTLTFTVNSQSNTSDYTWTLPNGGTILSGQGTTSITALVGIGSGDIEVVANNACGSSTAAILSFTVNAFPSLSISPSNPTICVGTNLVLTAQTANNYAWSNGDTSNTTVVSPIASTQYTVSGTANGCTSYDTVMITVNDLPIVDLGNDVEQCGGTVILDAGIGSSYAWSNGSTQQTLEVSLSGTYALTLVDNNACSASDTITVIFNDLPALSVSASNPTPCVYDGIVQLISTPSGGIWSGTGVTGDTFNPAIGVGFHDVFFDYTDSNGCSSTTTLLISVDACASVIETENKYSISVYPNPATTEFYVSANSTLSGVEMRLIDAAGRLVYTSSVNQIEQNQQVVIPVEKLEKGIYSLQINSNSGTNTVLVLVNH